MDVDFTPQNGQEGDGLIDQPTDWLDTIPDEFGDTPEADLGDGGYLKPWKTTDI